MVSSIPQHRGVFGEVLTSADPEVKKQKLNAELVPNLRDFTRNWSQTSGFLPKNGPKPEGFYQKIDKKLRDILAGAWCGASYGAGGIKNPSIIPQ